MITDNGDDSDDNVQKDRRNPSTLKLTIVVGFISVVLMSVTAFSATLLANDFIKQRDQSVGDLKTETRVLRNEVQELKEFKAIVLTQNTEIIRRLNSIDDKLEKK